MINCSALITDYICFLKQINGLAKDLPYNISMSQQVSKVMEHTYDKNSRIKPQKLKIFKWETTKVITNLCCSVNSIACTIRHAPKCLKKKKII